MFKKALLTAMVFTIAAVNGFSESKTPIGTLTNLEGVSDIARRAEETFFADRGEKIFLGDRIRTKRYSKAEISFADKSKIKLGPGTCVVIEEYRVNGRGRREFARMRLTRGKVEAIIAKTGKPDTFVIDTPNARGSIKGSDVFVFYQAGKTGTLVKEGSMSIVNPLHPESTAKLLGGDYVLVPFGKAPGEIRSFLDAEIKLHKRDVEPALIKKWLPGKGAVEMEGVVTRIAGTVRIYKKGAKDWTDLEKNDVLSQGDKVQTGDDGRVTVLLGNGNSIFLQSDTELTFAILRYDPATKEYENTFESEYGKIKTVIEKLGKKSTFQVRTPNAVVGVRGTIMYLDIGPGFTRAFYEGGTGVITSTVTGDTREVGAGQHSSVDASGAIATPVYTSGQQRANLDQSWTGMQAVDNYSEPTSGTASESTIQQSVVPAASAGANVVTDSGAVDLTDGTGVVDAITFAETSDQEPSPATIIYSETLPLNAGASSAGFSGGAGQAAVDIKSDGTWTATISGVLAVTDVPSTWNVKFENSASNDNLYLGLGSPGYSIGSGSTVDWTADVVPANSRMYGPSTDKELEGSASGQFWGPSPDKYGGTASGTWKDI